MYLTFNAHQLSELVVKLCRLTSFIRIKHYRLRRVSWLTIDTRTQMNHGIYCDSDVTRVLILYLSFHLTSDVTQLLASIWQVVADLYTATLVTLYGYEYLFGF